ncbi:prepilin-type N-terminal cleavage/methylation domain-containing protein [Nitratifractor sp.]
MKRPAFTLIEILVSVMLIAIVVTGILKIREQTLHAARFVTGRMQEELSNSLFLDKEALRYSGEHKDAYTILHRFGIKNDTTRRILKEIERDIRLSDPLPIPDVPIPLFFREISLKGAYSSRYFILVY